MRGARRRPYVDMVKEGNDAADRPGRNPEGRGAKQRPSAVARPLGQGMPAVAKRPLRGASCRRSPLQYRHIAAGDPPKPASHIASVAHVPIYEIGSKAVPVPGDRISHRPFRHPAAAGAWRSKNLERAR
jgi:hypothetical protein